MNPSEFWQNFKLGEEQEIACNFIYDGLRNLHDIDSLSDVREIFPILYNLSIGIERLLKVAVILLEFNDETDIEKFEKSLITHSHISLVDRIKKRTSFNIGIEHMALLELLSGFYKNHRYDRFNFSSLTLISKDKEALHGYLHKYLKIDTKEEYPLIVVQNSAEIQKFIGKVVKNIVKKIYSIIDKAATEKNIYTYEITGSSSKAAKILWGGEDITFEREDTALIEILIFLLQTKDSPLVDFIKKIEPLPLDSALDSDYLNFILHKHSYKSSSIIDEVESCQEDVLNLKGRLEIIDLIKNPNTFI